MYTSKGWPGLDPGTTTSGAAYSSPAYAYSSYSNSAYSYSSRPYTYYSPAYSGPTYSGPTQSRKAHTRKASFGSATTQNSTSSTPKYSGSYISPYTTSYTRRPHSAYDGSYYQSPSYNSYMQDELYVYGGQPSKRQWHIDGTISGIAISALPDYGSELDIVSHHFARKHSLDIDKSLVHSVRLGSGKVTTTLGTVQLPFKFKDVDTIYSRTFAVMRESVQDVILGKSFLKITETFTKFTRRLKMSFRSLFKPLRVRLVGSQKERVIGALNGKVATAIADTGSDVDIASKLYAHRHGMRIDRNPKLQTRLEFADGSKAMTYGIVKQAHWTFGQSSEVYVRDFYILEDLPYDVVLGNDFLFDSRAFQDHQDAFFEYEAACDESGWSELNLIRNIGRIDKWLRRMRSRNTEPAADQQVEFTAAITHQRELRQELQRRERIAEEISALGVSSQAIAQDTERLRQTAWERDRLRMRQPGAPTTLQSVLMSPSTSSGSTRETATP